MATYNLTDILDIVKLWGVDYPNKQKNRVKYDAFKKDLRKKIEETFDTEADALAAVTPELPRNWSNDHLLSSSHRLAIRTTPFLSLGD